MTRRLAWYCQEQINEERNVSEAYRECDQHGCNLPATHYYVWTKPQYACLFHAQQALNVAAAMGFPADIALFPDVEAKLWEYRESGWLVLGVTNQGGVAYGIKSPTDEAVELKAMFDLFERNPFHIVKSCYHHPKGKVEPYCHQSLLRKPQIGMLALCEFEAFQLGWVIDWPGSLLVGDRDEDRQCALRAEIKFQWAWEFFGREKPEQEET